MKNTEKIVLLKVWLKENHSLRIQKFPFIWELNYLSSWRCTFIIFHENIIGNF